MIFDLQGANEGSVLHVVNQRVATAFHQCYSHLRISKVLSNIFLVAGSTVK